MLPHARAIFVSDFLGDIAPIEAALTKAADRGVRGVLLADARPLRRGVPLRGPHDLRKSVGGGTRHETLKAGDLRGRYLERLAERKDRLDSLCRLTGWQYECHHTDKTAQSALLWVWRAMDGGHG